MELERPFAERSVDALRFLRRGSRCSTPSSIKLQDGATTVSFNGVRITPELMIALRLETNVASAIVTVDGGRPGGVGGRRGSLLLEIRFDEAAPSVLAVYQSSITAIWPNPAGEARIAFGRAQADAHRCSGRAGSMGAPLFDEA